MFRCLFPSTSSPLPSLSFRSFSPWNFSFLQPLLPLFRTFTPPPLPPSSSQNVLFDVAKVNASRFPRVSPPTYPFRLFFFRLDGVVRNSFFIPFEEATPWGVVGGYRGYIYIYIDRAARDLKGNPTRFGKDNIGFGRLLSFRLSKEIVTFLVLHIWLFGIYIYRWVEYVSREFRLQIQVLVLFSRSISVSCEWKKLD